MGGGGEGASRLPVKSVKPSFLPNATGDETESAGKKKRQEEAAKEATKVVSRVLRDVVREVKRKVVRKVVERRIESREGVREATLAASLIPLLQSLWRPHLAPLSPLFWSLVYPPPSLSSPL